MSIYDTGFGIVNENRRVAVGKGESEVVVRQVPAKLDPTTCSLMPLAGGAKLDFLGLRFEHDLAGEAQLFQRYLGRAVSVNDGKQEAQGKLVAGPTPDRPVESSAVALQMTDGSVRVFPQLDRVTAVEFPKADTAAFLDPSLVWNVRSEQEGQQIVRLSYLTAGLSWSATHEVTLTGDGDKARVSSRVNIANESGGRFNDARVRLVATEPSGSANSRRYSYGVDAPVAESLGGAIQSKGAFEVPLPVTLADGQSRQFELARAEALPVTKFFVYDGVRFDRYQRNPKNDWNYGAEFSRTVELNAEFQWPSGTGALPGGAARIYRELGDGGLDYLGRSDWMQPDENGRCHVRIGTARGMTGERERTGFTEVRPQHEYLETFEIRLSNFTEESAQVRVVEHLYRGTEYEIVKADAEYISPAPQVIEFRADLKPGGKRSLHYTVRYRW